MEQNKYTYLVFVFLEINGLYSRFGTMTHTPGFGNFSAKTPKLRFFSVVSYIVKS